VALLLRVVLVLVGQWQRLLLRHACCRQLHDCLLDDG
jgi:hypothetical protein